MTTPTRPADTPPSIQGTITARVGTQKSILTVKLPDGAAPSLAPGTRVLLTAVADQSGPASHTQGSPPTWCSYCDYPCQACLLVGRVGPSKVAAGVDPSSGVVELPDDAIDVLCKTVGHALATHPRITGSALANADGRSAVELRERVLTVIAGAAFPLIAARVRAEAAGAAAGMCHWVQDITGVQGRESHEAFHFGNPCPYAVVAAVLRDEPDPRDQAPNPFGALLLCGSCDRPEGITPA